MRHFIYLAVLSFVILPFATPAQAVSADAGRTTYASRCASCHGTLTNPWAVSAQTIQSAIQGNRGGMGSLSALSVAELQDIAAYMTAPSATTASSTTSTATSSSTTGSSGTATTPPTAALPSNSDIDRLYDWAESNYPQLFSSHGFSQDAGGYYSRYYQGSNLYLMARDGQLYLYDAGRSHEGMLDLGKVQGWLAQVSASSSVSRPQTHDSENEGRDRDDHGGDRDGDHDD
ncbi:MAG: c-type cytochrome [Sulfuricella sp.]|nr:c-type cytochrome [Sulfuricella sp.]